MALQGLVSYPGIKAWESFEITDCSGISPSIAIMEVYPQYGIPDATGDLVLTYDDTTITFKNCIIDTASFQRGSGGKTVSVRFLDERWKWQYGQITGRYNQRLPDNFVDPNHEKTPRELAELCFKAMGVEKYDVSALPNDARPDVDWVATNPAQELASLCDDLGCRIVPIRTNGSWKIVVTGEGNQLPDGWPIQDAGDGIDPKELPDFLQIVTAEISYQVALRLEPIGRDMDQSLKHVKELSYAPDKDAMAYGFGAEPKTFFNLSNEREVQQDGTAISPREMALNSVYRYWRVKIPSKTEKKVNGDNAIWIDGYNNYVSRKQIILTDKLVQCYTDVLGGVHQRPAILWGRFEATKFRFDDGNYPDGTRIDYQGPIYRQSPEERASFSLSLDPLDTDRSIVITSKAMTFLRDNTKAARSDGSFPRIYDFAKLFLTCGIQIRDPKTWQPIRHYRVRKSGPGNDPKNVMTFIKNDIQPWVINLYNNDGTFSSTSDNKDDINKQCDYYLDSIQKTLETIASSTRTYIGLFQIDLDGAIQQVTYRIGKQGADTIASSGTEHDFDIPQYAERRQRDGRKNIRERMKLVREIDQRRDATKGTFNTL